MRDITDYIINVITFGDNKFVSLEDYQKLLYRLEKKNSELKIAMAAVDDAIAYMQHALDIDRINAQDKIDSIKNREEKK